MSDSPERQLWCAVIWRALQDATAHVGMVADASEQERLREDARRWFAANDGDFRAACNSAGYDADLVRNHALRLSTASDRDGPANGSANGSANPCAASRPRAGQIEVRPLQKPSPLVRQRAMAI